MADDYDPHDYRNVQKPITNWEAFCQVLKCSIGTGLLAMPKAFSDGGWLVGSISCVIIGIIIMVAIQLLIKCIYKASKLRRMPSASYKDAAIACFEDGSACMRSGAKVAGYFVDFFLAFYHFGINVIYVVFIARSLEQVISNYSSISIDIRIYMVMILPLFLLIVTVKSFKHLVPLSLTANILICLGVAAILYYMISDLPPLSERDMSRSLIRYPMFVGTFLFAVESLGVLLAIEENMKTPKSFIGIWGILNIGLLVVVIIYSTFGLFGYWSYGNESKGSVTLNLPNEIFPDIIKIIYAIAILFSYPLHFYVAMHITWDHYIIKRVKEERQTLWEYIYRMVLATLSCIVAIALPNIGALIGLLGSFCLCVLTFILPGMMDLCLKHPDNYGPLKWHILKNIFLIILGIVFGSLGTYVSILDVIEVYANA